MPPLDRLLVATRSGGKKREITAILGGLELDVVFPDDVGIPPSGAEDSLETADNYAGNAAAKARYFAALTGLPTVADDSGIEVDALGGRPGVRSRRYAGVDENQDAANNSLMLRELEGLAPDERAARYRCIVAYLEDPDANPVIFEGTTEGRILTAPLGEGGFGYDPIFFSTDLKNGFGEVSQQLKETVSHRGRAFRAFREWLEGVSGAVGKGHRAGGSAS